MRRLIDAGLATIPFSASRWLSRRLPVRSHRS
jgi:hypothetical protein